MLLKELRKNDLVNLEIVKDKSVYEIMTRVAGVTDTESKMDRALLEPIEFKGKMFDMKYALNKKIVVNLYADDKDGNRVCWHDVSIKYQTYNKKTYYNVSAPAFSPQSQISDRRSSSRYKLNAQVDVYDKRADAHYMLNMNDVSYDGASFYSKEELDLKGDLVSLSFAEILKNDSHNVKLDCKIIRRWEKNGLYWYGGTVVSPTPQFLNYIHVKSLIEKYKPEELAKMFH